MLIIFGSVIDTVLYTLQRSSNANELSVQYYKYLLYLNLYMTYTILS